MPRVPVNSFSPNVAPGCTIAPLTFSATTRMFSPEAAANPPVVNSPMTSLMPSACAFSVVRAGSVVA